MHLSLFTVLGGGTWTPMIIVNQAAKMMSNSVPSCLSTFAASWFLDCDVDQGNNQERHQ